jgi:hypothetical protein
MARPTKYSDELADIVITMMSNGCSIQEVCLEMKICKQTFYNWVEQHPMFLDAKKKGEWFSEGWWMREGRKALRDKEFNYTGWYMNMKNRFGWADNQKTDITSKGDKITQVQIEVIRSDGDA